ncbi:MAG TPA: ACT domain-containing protein [Pyrinomonadaceae bacterium]|nr:ACT domain-containing protein [Pyrinomonadaceae bacterium]
MTNTLEASCILVAVGRDKPGLANTVAAFVRTCGCTIDDAEMETLRAYFAVLLRFCGSAQAVERVKKESREWGDNQGLDIRLYEDLPAYTPPPDALPYELRVDAIERIGIIDDLTRALPGYGVNIQKLDSRIMETAMTGAPRYELNATLQIPASKLDNVRETLDVLGLDYLLTPRRS